MPSQELREDLCEFCFSPLEFEMNIYGDVVPNLCEIEFLDGSFACVCLKCHRTLLKIADQRNRQGRMENWKPELGKILSHEYINTMRREVAQ
jgi:hypothetical protein